MRHCARRGGQRHLRALVDHFDAWEHLGVGSPQTLSENDRRIVAVWAADCAERVLGLFEAQAPEDGRPREAIARLRAFARGELGVAEARRRFVAHAAARDVSAPAAVAAARAAGQAASIPHMGAHALGAAAYAAKAAGLAAPDHPEAVSDEIRWQLGHMSAAARAALRQLPPIGENASGPLGRGLLSSGVLGTIIHDLQAGLADPDHPRPPRHEADPEHGEKEDQLVEGHARARLGITPETRLES
jgi:hypothetical protein